MSELEQTDEDQTDEGDTTDALDTAEYTDAVSDEEDLQQQDYGGSLPGDSKPSSRMIDEVKPKKKKKTWMEKCMKKKWTCDDMPAWRIFMNTFVEDQDQFEKDDIFKQRKPANLRRFPKVQSEEDLATPHKCLPLNAFQLRDEVALPNKIDRSKMIRIWRNMRANLPVSNLSVLLLACVILGHRSVHSSKSDAEITPQVSKTHSEKWPSMWPCTKRDLVSELKERRMQRRKKRKDLFPCDPDVHDREVFDDPDHDFSGRKELGHARIPQSCPPPTKDLLVDRAAGEQPGLVDGDYIIFELPSKARGNRIYADVCLRGLKGMHLQELHMLRTRQKTWKFCFYQAVIALLAKTQLRYKYAWNSNIDYIYDHAWLLFTHIGTINIKQKQRLDDIVVYNYKYSIEVEKIAELNDVPIVTDIPWDYEERNLKQKTMLERKELMNVQLDIGSEKIVDVQTTPVHKDIKRIEDLIDNLPIRFRNCIFRTTRFSLAFWKDNYFWYLYNPYRCDKFGYWDDDGYACIMKFCSRQSLKRHLMILLLRAYIYPIPKSDMQKEKEEDATKPEEPAEEEPPKEEFYTIQIFNVTYHCCQIHNLKLLQRTAPKPPKRYVKAKTIDECPFDPLDVRDPCTIEMEEGDLKDAIEKPTWLKLYKITWTKCSALPQKKKGHKDAPGIGKMRWHQYVVEESNKLFSLWGELHITDGMFERENRGMQTYACYVVCAGMTRIMAPEYWSSKILDVIVMCGDRYYTHSKMEAEFKSTKNEYSHVNCWNRYLMSYFTIGETMFEANVLPAICGRLYTKTDRYLWQSLEQMFLKYHFGILTCESSCVGIFKFCGAYYICDVNSFGPPLFQYGEGAAYLLRATYFYKFITTLVLTIGSPECSQFALNPIEILKVIDVGSSVLPIGRLDMKERGKRITKIECPYDEEKKRQMKRWKHKRQETARTIDKLCCKGAE
ncbi:uncharacterized protein LOC143177281 [Calliopsis andreniformis]|uniref:uncharacterized protein LOC143177281 n=1 Tax=Calliopsis andreniformis TaxID=337506 RepID=UPI003FCD3140